MCIIIIIIYTSSLLLLLSLLFYLFRPNSNIFISATHFKTFTAKLVFSDIYH